ncbi:hypothetical protein [Nodosilinea sp. LEGE 06152]|nr:hypothetical protein [Nodosilinea sp. LEGE 06152]
MEQTAVPWSVTSIVASGLEQSALPRPTQSTGQELTAFLANRQP